MEDTEECAPVTVEGSWTPAQAKTLKNKLQLYFQSKKKSGGGECRVEAEDGAPRAEVFFSSAEVRERVLARQNHEIVLDTQTVKLRLSSGASPKNVTEVPDSSADGKTLEPKVKPKVSASKENEDEENEDSSTDGKTPEPKVKPKVSASKENEDEENEEPLQSVSVVLDNIGDMSREMLLMLLDNISGLDDSHYSLEIISESNRAVVTFSNPTDGERFLSVGQSSPKLQKHKLSARQLEAAKSVRVERLPSNVIDDMLDLYFDKNWTQPENIVMIPEEEAAIVTFKDPKVVKSICIKEDYSIVSIPVKVYPYFESLSSALYGKERPSLKMPKPFTETVSYIIWKYLQEKKLMKSINDHMRQYFCNVNMDMPQAELTPLPNFLRQKGLTAQQVDAWESSARDTFRQHMSQYTAFERPANELAWKAAEAEVHSIIGGNVLLVFDGSRGVLTVAGGADDIKRIRAPVESIVLKAISQIERQTNGISDFVNLSPPMYFILQQVGLQKAAQDISPEMTLAYDKNSQKLTITGLSTEVSKTKIWILERNVAMSKKQIIVPLGILHFLRSVDPMDMSNHLFTSQGISTIFSVESKGVLLTGSSDRALTDAEEKMKEVLTVMDVDVEDQGVLNLQSWNDLKQQLLDSCNSKKMKTVSIQDYPGREDKITVAGFQNPVNEVGRSLTDFIWKYSRTQESIRVKSVVVQFIEKKKSLEWSSIAKDNEVKVNLDPVKQRIFIEGARLHVQKAKSCYKDLTSSLFCDHLSVNKPGAKKFFQSQEYWFQSVLMSDFGCVVMLRPENQEEEEEENFEENNGVGYCKVRTAAGVHVSVSKADICHFGVDVVVNAANEDLQHIGGLALAMLKAAGPQLQRISDNYVSKNGKLRPGEAILTDSCNLQCKYIVHAVGPRFSDTDRKTAVLRLKLAVTQSLKQAERKECTSIALPAISSGVFGFPVDLCAETIAQAVREYCDSPGSVRSLKEIHLVDNNDNTVRILAAAVNKEFSDLGPTMMVPSQAGGKSPKAAGGYQQGRGRGRQPPRNRESAESGGYHRGGRGGGEMERGGYHRGGRGGGERERGGYHRGGQGGGERERGGYHRGGQGGGERERGGYHRGGQGGGERERGGYHRGGQGGGERERGGYQSGGWGAGETASGYQSGHHHKRGGHSPSGHRRPGGHGGTGRMEQTTAEGLKIVLLKGNIQDQTTRVIVNTIAEDMNLNQGAVSNAILKAAGPSLQTAVQSVAGVTVLGYGDVVTTDGFNLSCQKVFHVVCPGWDNGRGQAEETLASIIRYCLGEAENLRMGSLSFPAIGTGNLNFPRDVVSRVLLREIKTFSSRLSPQHLREVVIVVHPSDSQTVDCFTKAFSGQTAQSNFADEAFEIIESPGGQFVSQPQQSSASFSQVSSPSLGVHQMQMGSLILEVSSGDITKETCDAIVNSSNKTFDLYSGVSKAILDSAGPQVQKDCAQQVRSLNNQSSQMILTSAGLLPSKIIIHVVGTSDPLHIKDTVYSVLKVCEENRFNSVALPALGTGQGGADPSLVADAMVEAVVDFVRKKHPKWVQSVKILIFQTFMVTEFHKSMKKKEGEEVAEKNIFSKLKDAVSEAVTSIFSWPGEQRRSSANLFLEAEEFEPTEFVLCADNERAVSQAKKKIEELILKEQAKKVIKDQYISQLSQGDMDELKDLQRNLTVSITLDRGQQGQEPTICLEGLTRDVLTAEVSIRAIFQKVERQVNLRNTAMVMSTVVQWQFQHPKGKMVAFDLVTNLKLEEAFKNQQTVQIQINNEPYDADPRLKKAVALMGHKMVELLRKDLKEDNSSPLPKHWDDMNSDLLKLIPLNPGDKEYSEVETLLKKTGLTPTIIKIERVQNPTLWQSYQLKKQQLEKKNKHKNNEKRLFHGTQANSIDLINQHGFNRSHAGKHAAMYGNGTYFAVDPCYSAKGYATPDPSGHKRMYLARVLVGDFTRGASGMITPPAKNSGNVSDLYDSVTDNTANPSMFIVFNDMHAYPEYLITFT